MTRNRPGSNSHPENPLFRPHVLRDLLIVGSPILLLGAAGNLAGIGTLLGGAIVNLGYVLAITIGGRILQLQGSGWRSIGLARPASCLKTAGGGVAAWIGGVLIFVLMQVVIVALLTVLGQSMPEIDQSRFNPVNGNMPLFLLMVILAWTTIAFGEELFYRAFLISRLVDHAAMGRDHNKYSYLRSSSFRGGADGHSKQWRHRGFVRVDLPTERAQSMDHRDRAWAD